MLHVPKVFKSLVFVQKLASLILYKIEFDGINAFLHEKVQGSWTGLA